MSQISPQTQQLLERAERAIEDARSTYDIAQQHIARSRGLAFAQEIERYRYRIDPLGRFSTPELT
jgi:hypothetical protein